MNAVGEAARLRHQIRTAERTLDHLHTLDARHYAPLIAEVERLLAAKVRQLETLEASRSSDPTLPTHRQQQRQAR